MAVVWKSNEMARFKCGLNPDRMEQCGSGMQGRDYRRDLQDGTYNFYVGAVDKIGNEATIIKHTFRIGKYRVGLYLGWFMEWCSGLWAVVWSGVLW